MYKNPFEKFLTAEDHLHIGVIRYLQFQYPKAVFFHAANEGRRTPFERYKIKEMGVRSGFPDLVIFFSGRHLAIELKVPGRKATDPQKEWIDFLRSQGWTAEVCRGFDQAKEVIDQFMKPKN